MHTHSHVSTPTSQQVSGHMYAPYHAPPNLACFYVTASIPWHRQLSDQAWSAHHFCTTNILRECPRSFGSGTSLNKLNPLCSATYITTRKWKHAFKYYAEGKGMDNVRKKPFTFCRNGSTGHIQRPTRSWSYPSGRRQCLQGCYSRSNITLNHPKIEAMLNAPIDCVGKRYMIQHHNIECTVISCNMCSFM